MTAAAALCACGGAGVQSPIAVSGDDASPSAGSVPDASTGSEPDATLTSSSSSAGTSASGSTSSGGPAGSSGSSSGGHGSSGDGGAPDAGGSGSSGVTSGSGGSSGGSTGGSTSGSGSASGGAKSGSSSSGGSSGGESASGSSSGGSASSSSGGGLCTYGTPTDGTGSFTWYYFGQGTAQQGGYYLTACGYQGTESGMIDTVQNIASTAPASATYFAAIPGSSGFDTVNDCGACVEITNGGTSIVATIIDECPTDNGQNPLCAQAGHLDLSYAAWSALHYPSGDPSGTTWKFVSCPVTGNVTTRVKSGNPDQVYIQNTVLPIVSVTYDGQAATHLSYGVWQLPNGAAASGATLVLTDVEGHTVTITVNGGDSGQQFPDRCP
jgi:expansin (peptidoglycan-binding protein)